MTRKKILAAFLCGCALSTPLLPARATSIKDIRDSISHLWNRNSQARHEARAARNAAASHLNNAQSLHFQLQKAGDAFLKAHEVFLNSRRQIKHTEAQIIETSHQIKVTQARYDAHKKLFGERLASMQRNGQIGYLNVLLGSRTLSELSRRAYLYQAIAERDADLQNQIKADREELQNAQNALQAQWLARHKYQQAAVDEQKRVMLAQRQTMANWKAAQNRVYAQLAFSNAKTQSAKDAQRGIYELQAQRNRIVETYERQQRDYERDEERESRRIERYTSAPRRTRRRYRSHEAEYSFSRPHRSRQRYHTVTFSRPVKGQRFIPSEGGVLKPMPIEKLERKTIKVPVEPKGGPMSDNYVVQDAPN